MKPREVESLVQLIAQQLQTITESSSANCVSGLNNHSLHVEGEMCTFVLLGSAERHYLRFVFSVHSSFLWPSDESKWTDPFNNSTRGFIQPKRAECVPWVRYLENECVCTDISSVENTVLNVHAKHDVRNQFGLKIFLNVVRMVHGVVCHVYMNYTVKQKLGKKMEFSVFCIFLNLRSFLVTFYVLLYHI